MKTPDMKCLNHENLGVFQHSIEKTQHGCPIAKDAGHRAQWQRFVEIALRALSPNTPFDPKKAQQIYRENLSPYHAARLLAHESIQQKE